MDSGELKILRAVADGRLSPEAALEHLGAGCVHDGLHGLTLDTQRSLRTGLGEVVFGQGKSDDALLAAVDGLCGRGAVLVTRLGRRQGALLQKNFPQGCFWPEARLFSVNDDGRLLRATQVPRPAAGDILVVSAGAADAPVALECYGTLAFFGKNCGHVSDVGVAGLHRLLPHIQSLRSARALVAVAGMEGALPGVLAGLVCCPVVAVPTSVGYGVGQGGFSALATMLCHCAPGMAVVNIDNGFGAAAFAAKLPG